MTDGDRGPLSSRVAEYVAEGNHDATPDEVLRECDLNESRREQVEHYLAVTRFGIFGVAGENDIDRLRFSTVEWSDVVEWEV